MKKDMQDKFCKKEKALGFSCYRNVTKLSSIQLGDLGINLCSVPGPLVLSGLGKAASSLHLYFSSIMGRLHYIIANILWVQTDTE